MLDKEFTLTPRRVLQTIMILLIGFVLIAANVDGYQKRKKSVQYENGSRLDSITKRIADLEAEISRITEENRLCHIIGAYTILNQNNTPPTPENVETFVIVCQAWYPDIIMAQYQLESISGTSSLAKHNKNLFGMHKAWTRKSVRCRSFDKMGYAIYNNWQLSVVDRIYWEEHVFNGEKPSKAQYLATIKKIYAKDEHYIEKIKRLAKNYEYLYDYIEPR